MKKYRYSIKDFDIVSEVEKIFNVKNLSLVHSILNENLEIPDDPSKDQKTLFHKIFYSSFEEDKCPFLEKYKAFVQYLKDTHFEDSVMIYQTRPTFRVHAPGNIAVAKWHKDKAYNHSASEINIYLPLTKAFGSNTIWSETEEDKGDYQPMEAEVGEYYIWNGANLLHGNKKNDTNASRVSIDFRLIHSENFDYDGTSVTTKVPMKLGYYWSKI
jgi:hypothetical protein